MRILCIVLSTLCFAAVAVNVMAHDVFKYDPTKPVIFWSALGLFFAVLAVLIRMRKMKAAGPEGDKQPDARE